MDGAPGSVQGDAASPAAQRWGKTAGMLVGAVLGVTGIGVIVSQSSLSDDTLSSGARLVGWAVLAVAGVLLVGRWRQGRSAATGQRGAGEASALGAGVIDAPLPRARKWSVDVLKNMDRSRFQALCCAFFRESGVAATTHAGDEDLSAGDIRLHQDPRRPGAVTAVVRCVPWGPIIDVWAVRALAESQRQERAERAFFMAPAGFAPEALAFAAKGKMTLFDSRLMLALIRRLPDDSQQRLLELASTGDWTAPACPECGDRMVVRNVIRRPFWGCSRFPQCRGTLPMNRKAGLRDEDGPLATV